MTREELKNHCQKQVAACEMWAKHNGEEPHGKIYEEHKLILELLEQESALDKIRDEIEEYKSTIDYAWEDDLKIEAMKEAYADCLKIIDEYKAEREDK